MLATFNSNLREMFLWNVYDSEVAGPLDDQSTHVSDMMLVAPKGYKVENMRWASAAY